VRRDGSRQTGSFADSAARPSSPAKTTCSKTRRYEDEEIGEDAREGLVGRLGEQRMDLEEGGNRRRLDALAGVAAPARVAGILAIAPRQGARQTIGARQLGSPLVDQVEGVEELEVPHLEGVQHLLERVELRQLLAVLVLRELALADPRLAGHPGLALAPQLAQKAERPAQVGEHVHKRNVLGGADSGKP
jgi:hypothetical protein